MFRYSNKNNTGGGGGGGGGGGHWHCIIILDQCFSGDKLWDSSLHNNSPYFTPAWDGTRDQPLSVESE